MQNLILQQALGVLGGYGGAQPNLGMTLFSAAKSWGHFPVTLQVPGLHQELGVLGYSKATFISLGHSNPI